jgi:hypothetical protein
MTSQSHLTLARESWFKLTLPEQLGNIGSEVSRASAAQGKTHARYWGAVSRALDLFYLTVEDPRWRKGRRREILRARELFCAAALGYSDEYKTSLEDLIKYFDYFALLARSS